MLSGGRLFDGDDVAVVLASIIKTEPDYSKLPHDVPAAVRSMLRACLQKEPADRIRNIGDVRLGLDGVFLADAPTDTTSGRRWRSAVVALGLGVAGVVIGALVGMNRTPFMNGTSVENLS